MRVLRVIVNDKGDVVGTAQVEVQGRGANVPGLVALVARPGQQVMEVTVDDEVANLDPSAFHEAIKAKYLRSAAASVASVVGIDSSGSQSMPQKDRPSSR